MTSTSIGCDRDYGISTLSGVARIGVSNSEDDGPNESALCPVMTLRGATRYRFGDDAGRAVGGPGKGGIMQGRRRRISAALLSGFVATALMSVVAAPVANARPKSVNVTIDSQFHDDGFATHPDGATCAGTDAQTCEMQFHGSSTTTGNLHGTETYRIWFYQEDGQPASRTYETFTGWIEGCSTSEIGSLEFTLTDVQPQPSAAHPPAVVEYTGTWELVAGSGRGGLAGVTSGSGTEHGYMLPTTENYGEFRGEVACRPAR